MRLVLAALLVTTAFFAGLDGDRWLRRLRRPPLWQPPPQVVEPVPSELPKSLEPR